jgi:hypothetical protein
VSRKLPDWIGAWLEYSANIESPARFRLWAAISTLSAALERRIFTQVKGQFLFPNTYIILVGPPGSGKGNAIKELRAMLDENSSVTIAPDGLTKQSFYEVLEGAAKSDTAENALEVHSPLYAYIEELGVFLQPGDSDFIYTLCHVFDCPPKFHYKTKTAGENFVERACFGFVAGATPKALRDIFTEQAMELGISARTMLIFADDKVNVEVFGVPKKNEKLQKDLKHDLFEITGLRGEYTFAEDAAEEVVKWHGENMKPPPSDPRFEHYNARRFIQFVKLCMIVAVSKRSDPIISLSDVEVARKILLEAEKFMPQAIVSLGANPMLMQQQTAIKFINGLFEKTNAGVKEFMLRRRLTIETNPAYVDVILDQLEHAKWVTTVGKAPNRTFYPRGKEPGQDLGKKEEDD